MKTLKIFRPGLIFLLLVSIVISCVKEEEYPIVPAIEFEDFVLLFNTSENFIDRGVLKLTFKDGDGDIGLTQNETEPPYDYNMYISYYEIQFGDTVRIYNNPVNGDTLIFNARIPLLLPEGSEKSIHGEIQDTLLINYKNSEFDTIMFEVYIMDRALHESNTIQTPLIIRNFDLD